MCSFDIIFNLYSWNCSQILALHIILKMNNDIVITKRNFILLFINFLVYYYKLSYNLNIILPLANLIRKKELKQFTSSHCWSDQHRTSYKSDFLSWASVCMATDCLPSFTQSRVLFFLNKIRDLLAGSDTDYMPNGWNTVQEELNKTIFTCFSVLSFSKHSPSYVLYEKRIPYIAFLKSTT